MIPHEAPNMEAILLDEREIQELQERRRQTGADRYDEVWEGVYVMAPLANNEHQRIATALARVFMDVAGEQAHVLAGANVSARGADWAHDYRCPDVVVVLPGGTARDAGTHWQGGPDLVVEVVSPNDRSREKLAFYASLGVREVLLVERDPKALEVHVLRAGSLVKAASSTLPHPSPVTLSTLGLILTIDAVSLRIGVEHSVSGRRWTI